MAKYIVPPESTVFFYPFLSLSPLSLSLYLSIFLSIYLFIYVSHDSLTPLLYIYIYIGFGTFGGGFATASAPAATDDHTKESAEEMGPGEQSKPPPGEVCMYVCMYVCMFIYICVCVCTFSIFDVFFPSTAS